MKKKIYKSDYFSFTETHRRIFSGVYFGTNEGAEGKGWILLVKLPFGYGMNIGTGFSGFFSVRSWDWAKYDYADHFSIRDFQRWMRWPNAKH